MRVAVCTITYKRAEGLRRLLDGLAALTFRDETPNLRLIVIDNDENASAKPVRDSARPNLPWPLEYHIEPRRGIPQARNAAVATALSQQPPDFIAFIDDDEVPDPHWLDELLYAQREYHADVVTGPVEPCFEADPPPWATRGHFFAGDHYPTGTRLTRAHTNNVLIRRAVLDRVRPHFDERLALIGGEDTHFFRRVHNAGFSIVWTGSARVTEFVPRQRVQKKWIYRRAFRIGTATAFLHDELHARPVAAAIIITIGLARIAHGLIRWPLTALAGEHHRVRSIRWMSYGAGLLAGLFGIRHEEYRHAGEPAPTDRKDPPPASEGGTSP